MPALLFSQTNPALNLRIALDQAKSEPPSIITLAVMRCNDHKEERKPLAPTIVPGAHPLTNHLIPLPH